jgi:hypothetical protein
MILKTLGQFRFDEMGLRASEEPPSKLGYRVKTVIDPESRECFPESKTYTICPNPSTRTPSTPGPKPKNPPQTIQLKGPDGKTQAYPVLVSVENRLPDVHWSDRPEARHVEPMPGVNLTIPQRSLIQRVWDRFRRNPYVQPDNHSQGLRSERHEGFLQRNVASAESPPTLKHVGASPVLVQVKGNNGLVILPPTLRLLVTASDQPLTTDPTSGLVVPQHGASVRQTTQPYPKWDSGTLPDQTHNITQFVDWPQLQQ